MSHIHAWTHCFSVTLTFFCFKKQVKNYKNERLWGAGDIASYHSVETRKLFNWEMAVTNGLLASKILYLVKKMYQRRKLSPDSSSPLSQPVISHHTTGVLLYCLSQPGATSSQTTRSSNTVSPPLGLKISQTRFSKYLSLLSNYNCDLSCINISGPQRHCKARPSLTVLWNSMHLPTAQDSISPWLLIKLWPFPHPGSSILVHFAVINQRTFTSPLHITG